MYQVSVEGHFDAAHYLRDYGGKCENIHGHRFKVVVSLKATKLNEIGLAYDFTELKRHLGEVLERFDHTSLNDVPPFDKINPSSENIAVTVYDELKGRFPGGVSLLSVEVWESPQSCVTYRPE
ncbi:MAG: 6-carboxytetrahydropterin synthase QueD [Chloroflexi bacterium RBG_13_50_10]|nr:MAG: 6-carboxytetrahydropterin synthase QueD [Chloroflexi bacterium RBG_13_50_10]